MDWTWTQNHLVLRTLNHLVTLKRVRDITRTYNRGIYFDLVPVLKKCPQLKPTEPSSIRRHCVCLTFNRERTAERLKLCDNNQATEVVSRNCKSFGCVSSYYLKTALMLENKGPQVQQTIRWKVWGNVGDHMALFNTCLPTIFAQPSCLLTKL